MKRVLLVLIAVGIIGSTQSFASGSRTIALHLDDVEAVTTPAGSHYIVEFDPPQGMTFVRHAWLEVRFDVAAVDSETVADAAPMLDVYMLKHVLSDDPVPNDFESTALPMSRPVAVGENRLVRIEITEFVRRILTNPETNHGIILGDLTGTRSGGFTIKTDGFGPGTPVRLIIVE